MFVIVFAKIKRILKERKRLKRIEANNILGKGRMDTLMKHPESQPKFQPHSLATQSCGPLFNHWFNISLPV